MEFIIEKEIFNKAITEVSIAIAAKSASPALSGIKIVANHDRLTLIGRNSDIIIEKAVTSSRELEIIKTGSAVIPAKYLSELAKKMPSKIHVKTNIDQFITIQSEEVIIKLAGINSEEYPDSPEFEPTKYISIPNDELISMIKQTTFAVSKNFNKPVLTGLNFSISENKLTCVATNSQRLALRELTTNSIHNGSFIVPGNSLNELSKLIQKESTDITIYLSNNYILFKTGSISFYSNLIEGSYPNTSNLFPKNAKTVIVLDTKQLLKGIDRTFLFSNEWRNNNVNLEIVNGSKLKISSHGSEIGKIEEVQTIKEIAGEGELMISFDANFLLSALKVIEEPDVRISFSGPMSPIRIEPVNNTSFVQLISPVRAY